MDVSIIIINYNTLKMTQECIDSVFEKTSGVEFEVILVDNSSTDGSKEHFNKDRRIKYIYSEQNLGFGKGNNLGFKHSLGKYLFFLNSDTLLLNNAVKALYDYMESVTKKVGCCGTLLYNKNNQPVHSYAQIIDINYFIKLYLFSIIKQENIYMEKYFAPNQGPYPQKVGYITGADIFMRRTLAEEFGLFDRDFFMYYEESEMQFRYTVAGYEMHVIENAKIQHLEGGSSDKRIGFLHAMRFLDSERLYCQKTMSLAEQHLVGLVRLFKIPRVILGHFTLPEKLKYIWSIIKYI